MSSLSNLRIQHFRLIRALSESKTLQQAASKIDLTQSAASKLLNDLEQAFGSRLFDRGRQGLHATATGTALVARAERVLNELDATRQEQRAIRENGSMLLRIGGLPIALVELMPAIFSACRSEWPDLLLQTREATARQLVEDVLEGVVDCGLGRLDPAQEHADLLQDELIPAELVVVASGTHPLARRRRLDPPDLLQFEWIVPPPGTVTRAALSAALVRSGLAMPPVALESDASFGTLLAFVREFRLLALMPKAVVGRPGNLKDIRILPTGLDVRLPPLAFLRHQERAADPTIRRMRRVVLGVVGKNRQRSAFD